LNELNDSDARTKAACPCGGIVGAAIADDDDLRFSRWRALKERAEAALDDGRFVVRGDDDGEGGRELSLSLVR
jgi:hypothetical protein